MYTYNETRAETNTQFICIFNQLHKCSNTNNICDMAI